ncbi:nuclear transport factor 2 family protein [Streptomyces sp. NPDC001139]
MGKPERAGGRTGATGDKRAEVGGLGKVEAERLGALNTLEDRITTAASAVLGAAAVPAVAVPHGPAAGHAAHGHGGYADAACLAHQKSVAVAVVKGVFERGDTAVVDGFVRPDYIQHNPTAADGSAGLKGLATLGPSAVPRRPVRRQARYLQGGKLAEHWDVIQNVPDTTASGNDMF